MRTDQITINDVRYLRVLGDRDEIAAAYPEHADRIQTPGGGLLLPTETGHTARFQSSLLLPED